MTEVQRQFQIGYTTTLVVLTGKLDDLKSSEDIEEFIKSIYCFGYRAAQRAQLAGCDIQELDLKTAAELL